MTSASRKYRAQNPGKFQPRPHRTITAEYLEKAALFYLQRYASSAESLRRVLMRRLQRNGVHKQQEFVDMVNKVVAKIHSQGLLDDVNYAWHRIQNLTQSGKSLRRVRAHLQQKGVAEEDMETAMEKILADDPDVEYQAALKFAKRKKLGPYRTSEIKDPQKQFQQFAQAGFSYIMAKRILQMTMDDAE